MRYAIFLALLLILGNRPALSDSDCVFPGNPSYVKDSALMKTWIEDTRSKLEVVLQNESIPSEFENSAECECLIGIDGTASKKRLVVDSDSRRRAQEYILRLLEKAQPLLHLPDGVSGPQTIDIAIRHSKILVSHVSY
jgi:hypothetical protein